MPEATPVSHLSEALDSKVPRRDVWRRAAALVGAGVATLKSNPSDASEGRKLQQEGVQIVDREIESIVFEAHHNPLIDEGTLRLHICIEDQGVADVTSRQLNEVAGTTPGYLVIDHKEPYDHSCFDVNAVTGQVREEIDEVLLGIDGSEEKHVWRFNRATTGELSGEYIGTEIIDFSNIHRRDDPTPQA